MKTVLMLLLASITAKAGVDIKERATISQDDTTTLYQVGENGEYCVSLTPDTSGCVSGIDDNGSTVNLLDLVKGKYVVFQNLSDAPHDMKFTGQNQDNLPPQDPGASPVEKKMTVEDLQNQKINCSFHGDMLAVGYRVPGDGDEEEYVVSKDEHAAKKVSLERPDAAPARALKTTGLANVSNEIIKKGSPAVVEKLLSAKPELIKSLADVRPLLAKEMIDKGIGVNIPPGQNDSNGGPVAGALFDTGAPRGPDGKLLKGGVGGPGTQFNDPKKSSAKSVGFRVAIGEAKTAKEKEEAWARRNGIRNLNGGGRGNDGGASEGTDSVVDEASLAEAFNALADGKLDSDSNHQMAANGGGANVAPSRGDRTLASLGTGVDVDPEEEAQIRMGWRLLIGGLGLSIWMMALLLRRKKAAERKG